MIAIDGLRWHQTMAAMPMLDYHLSKLTDEDLEKSAAKQKRENPLRTDLKRIMLSKFAPDFLLLELFGPTSSGRRVKPIAGLGEASGVGHCGKA